MRFTEIIPLLGGQIFLSNDFGIFCWYKIILCCLQGSNIYKL
jgi:hypothetical protein